MYILVSGQHPPPLQFKWYSRECIAFNGISNAPIWTRIYSDPSDL
jgi:hypothetical protein